MNSWLVLPEESSFRRFSCLSNREVKTPTKDSCRGDEVFETPTNDSSRELLVFVKLKRFSCSETKAWETRPWARDSCSFWRIPRTSCKLSACLVNDLDTR